MFSTSTSWLSGKYPCTVLCTSYKCWITSFRCSVPTCQHLHFKGISPTAIPSTLFGSFSGAMTICRNCSILFGSFRTTGAGGGADEGLRFGTVHATAAARAPPRFCPRGLLRACWGAILRLVWGGVIGPVVEDLFLWYRAMSWLHDANMD